MYICICIYVFVYIYRPMCICITVRNNFVQLSSNFCVKIAVQIVNWVAICCN